MLPKSFPVVANRIVLLVLLFSMIGTLSVDQLVHAPVAGMVSDVLTPLITMLPVRDAVPFRA